MLSPSKKSISVTMVRNASCQLIHLGVGAFSNMQAASSMPPHFAYLHICKMYPCIGQGGIFFFYLVTLLNKKLL